MAAGIYKITNTINNKFYIGSTIDFRRSCAGLITKPILNKYIFSYTEDVSDFRISKNITL